jgi:membrane protease YdiL (CAAX protease family)
MRLAAVALFYAGFVAGWALLVQLLWVGGLVTGGWQAQALRYAWWGGAALLGAFTIARGEKLGFTWPSTRSWLLTLLVVILLLAKDWARVSFLEARSPALPALAAIGAAVLAPVIEEILFRGVIQSALRTRFSTWGAIFATSALFTLAHVPGWVLLEMHPPPDQIAAVFLIGVVCGWLKEKTGSLAPPVLAHIANNIGASF